jgi:hypothetical protein
MEGRPDDMRPRTPELRISDHDRHQVAEILRHAAGEGRIDLEELDERLEATYAAKTYADLVPITADLPVQGPAPTGPPVPQGRRAPAVPAATYTTSFSVMGDCTRRGVWQVPERHTAFSLMGGVTLDLREAVFAAREVTIDAVAIMAGIDVIVNAQTQVIIDGIGIMGDFSQSKDSVAAELTAGSPVVRVRGMALMAGVVVKRKAMPDASRRIGRG